MPRLVFSLTIRVGGVSYLRLPFYEGESLGGPNEIHALAGADSTRG